ncbi:hypothetical protein, partial [Nocardia abscessus]|uniref:hypothetical protein n=1 Tax=Nocardia abscessus TaxID=120957 RepID=UPI002457F5C1
MIPLAPRRGRGDRPRGRPPRPPPPSNPPPIPPRPPPGSAALAKFTFDYVCDVSGPATDDAPLRVVYKP